MVTPELISYIQTQLAAGVSRDALTALLTGQGWLVQDIQEAFNFVSTGTAVTATPIAQVTPIASNIPAVSAVVAKSGFSIGKIILGFLALAVVGGGGFLAYRNFSNPISIQQIEQQVFRLVSQNTAGNISSYLPTQNGNTEVTATSVANYINSLLSNFSNYATSSYPSTIPSPEQFSSSTNEVNATVSTTSAGSASSGSFDCTKYFQDVSNANVQGMLGLPTSTNFTENSNYNSCSVSWVDPNGQGDVANGALYGGVIVFSTWDPAANQIFNSLSCNGSPSLGIGDVSCSSFAGVPGVYFIKGNVSVGIFSVGQTITPNQIVPLAKVLESDL